MGLVVSDDHSASVCLASYRGVTSQLKCCTRVNLLHGGRSWKQQCPFKDKPHDDDDDDDDYDDDNDDGVYYRVVGVAVVSFLFIISSLNANFVHSCKAMIWCLSVCLSVCHMLPAQNGAL